ncbi:3-methyladenine DNA glycosylase [Boudabousia liubingyangii]|uniref:3-methyladenine DNA glycosylase n=1 Tax=Boudabousia liubingyangii TaxID=1921764 RepID=UPI000A908987|nr:3-methyladenine DNA glycosylase [Boudabousia liubingyangii]
MEKLEDLQVLPAQSWVPQWRTQIKRGESLGAGRRYRAARSQVEPISDFLFEYYGIKPRHLTQWHPGIGLALLAPTQADSDSQAAYEFWEQLGQKRFYHQVETPAGPAVTLDVQSWVEQRGRGGQFIIDLLSTVANREGFYGCLGLHEWAMVYQGKPRHDLPLRLGAQGADQLTSSLPIRCTHFDAFRFFTPEARPFNQHQPDGSAPSMLALEQPGCLHQNMDLLRYALKLGPLVSTELLLDCFEFALEVRTLDMAASPYDCSGLGLAPVKIETVEGKAQYIAQQRQFTETGRPLRQALIDALTAAGYHPSTHPQMQEAKEINA